MEGERERDMYINRRPNIVLGPHLILGPWVGPGRPGPGPGRVGPGPGGTRHLEAPEQPPNGQ